MPAPASRRRSLRIASVVIGVCLAAAAAEAWLRITHTGVWAPREDDYGLLDAGKGYWYFDTKHVQGHRWDRDPFGRLPPGATMTYPLNAEGLRGSLPQPGAPCVLVLGDSFTFGEGVAEADTFVARVERALKSRAQSAPVLVNTGTPGYGTLQEAARLPSLMKRFLPRAVLLVYVPNDPIPLDECWQQDDLLRGGVETPALYLPRLVLGVAAQAPASRASEEWYQSYYFGERRHRWEEARSALAAIKVQCAEAGVPFGVALFPLLYRLDAYPFAKVHETVAAACAAEGIPCVDLTPILAQEPDRALWVHPADHHPDARAHELAAQGITPFVETLLR